MARVNEAVEVLDAPLTQDILCAKCGYNLRTKRPSEKCPECGSGVSDSLKFAEQFADIRLGFLAVGALCIASPPLLTLLATFASKYLSGSPLYWSEISFFVAATIASFLILFGALFLSRSLPTSLRSLWKWPINGCIVLAILNVLIQSYYLVIDFHGYYHDESFTATVKYGIARLHGHHKGAIDPSIPFWRWDLALYTIESAITLCLSIVARGFALGFAAKYIHRRNAFMIQIGFSIACFIAFFQCFQRTMALMFDLGEYTVAPLVLVVLGFLPNATGSAMDFTFGAMQVLYWTVVAVLALHLRRHRRRMLGAGGGVAV